MKFGVKIVDNSYTKNPKTDKKYGDFMRGMDGHELAIMNGSEILPSNFVYHTFHSDYKILNIKTFLEDRGAFFLYFSTQLYHYTKPRHIKNTTIHITNSPDKITNYSDEQVKSYVQQLVTLSQEYKMNFFIENMLDSVDDMKKIFSYDVNNVLNFTFDIGHAKCFNNKNNIEDWLDFIKDFKNSIHVHFHANNGLGDQHLPITSTTNKWINEFHCGMSYKEIAKKIISIRGNDLNSSFITESHSLFTKSNKLFLDFLKEYWESVSSV